MSRRLLLLLCLPFALGARAADDLDAMNAVSAAWGRYAELAPEEDPAVVALYSGAHLRHFGFLRDAALYASAEQVRRLPPWDRLVVMALRLHADADALAALDERGVATLCWRKRICSVWMRHADARPAALSHVTLIGADRAVGEVGAPDGEQFFFGPDFVREDGAWRIEPEALSNELSALIAEQGRTVGERALLEHLLGDTVGGEGAEPPSLVTVEGPLREDAAQRTRLNERWPAYDTAFRRRLAALERKAEDGDPLALWQLGALTYAGHEPLVRRDRERAIEQTCRALAVALPVELEPQRLLGGSGNLFERLAGERADDHLPVLRRGRHRAGAFTVRMLQALVGDRRQQQRVAQGFAEQFDPRVAAAHVGQWSRSQRHGVERSAVGATAYSVAAAVEVVPDVRMQQLTRPFAIASDRLRQVQRRVQAEPQRRSRL